MKFVLFILIISNTFLFAQKNRTLEKDIDFDNILDTIYVDNETSKIVCLLSSNKFSKIESKRIGLNTMSGIGDDGRDGFVFSNHYMRAGYSNKFKYDKKIKKIRLIGIDFYEFGDTNSNDPFGKTSINLLTGDLIGNWNYYEEKEDKFIKIPTVKTKMLLRKQYLNEFNEDNYFDFCDKLYKFSCEIRDKILEKKRKTTANSG